MADAAAADRMAQVLFEALVGHPASVGRAARSGGRSSRATFLAAAREGLVAVDLERDEGEEDGGGSAPVFSFARRSAIT